MTPQSLLIGVTKLLEVVCCPQNRNTSHLRVEYPYLDHMLQLFGLFLIVIAINLQVSILFITKIQSK